MFAGIDQEGAGLFRESAILGPARDDAARRIVEQNLDSLLARETQLNGAVAAIGQGDVNGQLADFRELDRFRRQFDREDEAAQFRVLVLRDLFRRAKGMNETTEPTALLLGGRAADACEQNQRDEN